MTDEESLRAHHRLPRLLVHRGAPRTALAAMFLVMGGCGSSSDGGQVSGTSGAGAAASQGQSGAAAGGGDPTGVTGGGATSGLASSVSGTSGDNSVAAGTSGVSSATPGTSGGASSVSGDPSIAPATSGNVSGFSGTVSSMPPIEAGAPGTGNADAGAVVGRTGDNDSGPAADAGAGPIDDDCVGGWTGQPSTSTQSRTPVSGYGGVQVKMPVATQIVALSTVLTVPAKPPASGTLFLWPGLQPLPGGANFNPIGNGVLQPVLTWGGTCAPNAPESFASWWISAQYVNTYAKYMGHTGCMGGVGMDVAVGDSLAITMSLTGTTWKQVVVDMQTGEQASYDIDMLGQAQDWAIFSIEPHAQEPVSDVVFTSTRIVVSSPETSACQPSVRGQTDYFSTPSTSSDGLTCCISRIILRAQGVAATTPDGP